MADLVLKGTLNLMGNLTLKGSGGKVMVGALEALVELTAPTDAPHCTSAVPVILPPPPAPKPVDDGPNVWIINSFNKTVTADTKAIVTQGIIMQGNIPTWPGMVLRGSSTVTINNIPINVQNDKGVVFPSGGTATFTNSGQKP
jgi:hypothetical protein